MNKILDVIRVGLYVIGIAMGVVIGGVIVISTLLMFLG
jgi:tetrahydromethanopterin S-methyltransferase subunit F